MARPVRLELERGIKVKLTKAIYGMAIDDKHGRIYVSECDSVNGNVQCIRLIPQEEMYVELKRVGPLSHFPPGLLPIIVGYADDNGEMETIYETSPERSPIRHIGVDPQSGIVLGALRSAGETSLLQFSPHDKTWKNMTGRLTEATSITNDGTGGFYFAQNRSYFLDSFVTLRHMTLEGHMTIRLSTGKDTAKCLDRHWFRYGFNSELSRLVSFPLTDSPYQTFCSTELSCCQSWPHSLALSVTANLLFVAHTTHVCAIRLLDGSSYTVCSFTNLDWEPVNKTCIGFYTIDRPPLHGYLIVLTGTHRQEDDRRLHHVPIFSSSASSDPPPALPSTQPKPCARPRHSIQSRPAASMTSMYYYGAPVWSEPVYEFTEQEGHLLHNLGGVSDVAADMMRGRVYFSAKGDIRRIAFTPQSGLDSEMRRVPLLAQFPPGLRPIIAAYAGNSVCEEIHTIYQADPIETMEKEDKKQHVKKGVAWPVSKMAVDSKSGVLVATVPHHPTTKMIRIDQPHLVVSSPWYSWKHSSDIRSNALGIASDGERGFYFIQTPYRSRARHTPPSLSDYLDYSDEDESQEASIRHVTHDGWVRTHVVASKDCSSIQPLDEIYFRVLAVSPVNHHIYTIPQPKVNRAPPSHVVWFRMPDSPRTTFESSTISCCGSFIHSIAYSDSIGCLFIAHRDHVCAYHHHLLTARRVCSFPHFPAGSKVRIAYSADPQEECGGYLFIVVSEKLLSRFYYLPVSPRLFDSYSSSCDGPAVPSQAKRRKIMSSK